MLKRLLPIALLALTACSGSSVSTDTTIAIIATTATTVPVTTTTVPDIFNPASGEKAIECDNKAVGASYGEKVKLEFCTTTWAMGDTDQDTWNCPKEGCAQTRLYRLVGDKWTSPVICRRDKPLTRFALSCYVPNAGPATLAEIPPRDVACIIWQTNKSLTFVEETGCTPSKAEINASLSTECTGYFADVTLPLEKCDTGGAVTVMQKQLRAAGYTVSVDGYFGPAMAKAVYAFQGKKSLQQLGIIDSATWNALSTKPFPG
jgi:Putative peptidoglycan binding domain